MEKLKKETKVIIVIVFVLIVLFIYNFYVQKLKFLEINVYEWLELIFLIVISYYLTERNSDKRNLNAKTEKIVEDLQNIVNYNRDMIKIKPENMSEVLNNIRIMGNKISVLKSISLKNSNIKERVEYIEKQFEKYSDIIDINQDENVDFFERKHDIIYLYMTNISSKLDDIILILYDCQVPKIDGYQSLN